MRRPSARRTITSSKRQLSLQQAIDLAVDHHLAGRLAEAEGLYRAILEADPGQAVPYHYLGVLATQAGRHDQAIPLIQRALKIAPNDANAHYNLGTALQELGRSEEAEACFRRSLDLDPDNPEGFNNLGNLLHERGRLDEAEASFRRAIQLKPDFAEAHNNLSNPLRKTGRFEEAEACSKRALELRPNFPEAHANLIASLRDDAGFDAAETTLRRILEANPNDAPAWANLAGLALARGRAAESLEAGDRALALDPGHRHAAFNRSLALLTLGHLEEGFRGYEERWTIGLFQEMRRRAPPTPPWDGSPLPGGTLLVMEEQGMGDALQFIRYLPLVAERVGPGARVLLTCRPALVRILGKVPGVDEVIPRGGSEAPRHDRHVSLLSLPHLFGTTLETIPYDVPYLFPDGGPTRPWEAQLAALPRPRVGLVWGGNPDHANDARRSIPLARFRGLLETPGVSFVSLQVGAGHGALDGIPDLGGEFNDFSDTAAALSHLDLLICVDTAPAHLAGAMGVPVWIPIPVAPDWRWLLDREDSPWYPGVRLFRQEKMGEWEPVLEKITAKLAVFRDQNQ